MKKLVISTMVVTTLLSTLLMAQTEKSDSTKVDKMTDKMTDKVVEKAQICQIELLTSYQINYLINICLKLTIFSPFIALFY